MPNLTIVPSTKSRFLPYFTYTELKCPCCGEEKMDEAFMRDVIDTRIFLGVPFKIAQGGAYRCPRYEKSHGRNGKGAHTHGKALDIITNSRLRSLILKEFKELGYTRFGINRGSTHVDSLTAKEGFDEDVIWTYYKIDLFK